MSASPKSMILSLLALALSAQAAANPPATAPSLIVAISVDQFSADLFSQYRGTFIGGLKRLAGGVVFARGYQSHAATETCPGHSTILTGLRPGHTGMIANNWIDQSVSREDKLVYCLEDPSVAGSSSKAYTPSLVHLLAPTLGDRMKAVDADSRVVSVSGKDRAAMLMGGKGADQIWWWSAKGFVSLPGATPTAAVTAASTAVTTSLAADHAALDVPAHCAPLDHAVIATPNTVVGTGRFARKAGAAKDFRASPELDAATLALAGDLAEEQQLGRRGHADLLGISLSATDYVGHRYGTEGLEMCLQIAALDTELGRFFDRLDQSGVDYMVVLTADHGGHDLPERNRENAAPDAARVDPALYVEALNKTLAQSTGIAGPLLLGDAPAGDIYMRATLTPVQKRKVSAAALTLWRAHPQVARVFTKAEIAAAPEPSGPPESWSLLDEAKASFHPDRSGDFLVLLKPRVTPIADPDSGAVATHGSPWDYDRRVPILFWRRGLTPFEQPLGVETVDILPTLAAALRLPLTAPAVDGRCLDIIAGPPSLCP